MASDRLNDDQVDDVFSGRRPAGRGVPEAVEHVIGVLHASREMEPPPMSDELRAEVYGIRPGSPAEAEPPHTVTAVVGDAKGRPARRAVASMAAAAALLVGIVLAATLPEGKAGRSDLGETPVREPSSSQLPATVATTVPPTGDIADPAPPESVAPSPTAEPPPAAAPVPPSAGATTPPEAPDGGGGDGRPGDGDGDGAQDGGGGRREDAPDGERRRRNGAGAGDEPGTGERPTSTAPSTTSTTQQESSTTSTTTEPPGDTTTTTTSSGPDNWWWDVIHDPPRSPESR